MAQRRKPRRRPPERPDRARIAAADEEGAAASGTPPADGGGRPGDRLSRPRHAGLDSLRGLAIALMIVDHFAGIVLQISIHDSLRLATRLSMPLFCVLMGYFLQTERRLRLDRLGQILAAAIVANLLFWPYYHRIEILGSLLVAYLVFLAAGRFFPALVLSILLYPVDPLARWFDFPPTIAVSFVAQGMLLRRWGMPAAGLSGAILVAAGLWIQEMEPGGVNHKLCWFVLPATLLVYLVEPWKSARITLLHWAGRHPLSCYLAQYFVIFALAYWWPL
jgi:hypothetical protein